MVAGKDLEQGLFLRRVEFESERGHVAQKPFQQFVGRRERARGGQLAFKWGLGGCRHVGRVTSTSQIRLRRWRVSSANSGGGRRRCKSKWLKSS